MMETVSNLNIANKSVKPVSTMKAAALAAPLSVTIESTPLPQPQKDEVRIKIQGCGVCASSIPVWEGRDWFSYPVPAGSPGHEGWGIIDAVGNDVSGFKIGHKVACLSYNAFAEYDVARASQVVKLPSSLNDMPFPGEALGCVMNIFNRSDIKSGQTVAVVGAGFIGLLLIELAKAAGAKVIAVSKREFSLNAALTAGADNAVAMDDHYKIINKVKELTGGSFCDRVIEVTGKEWPLNLAIELTAERGKLIVAGYHQDGMRQVNMQLLNWRGIDMINAHERNPEQYIQGIKQAIKAIEEGRMNPFPLFTHSFPLKETGRAFDMLTARPDGFIKALIVNTEKS
jgi:threonine dehydrogenase-like Zn-dependent dehydrogenase